MNLSSQLKGCYVLHLISQKNNTITNYTGCVQSVPKFVVFSQHKSWLEQCMKICILPQAFSFIFQIKKVNKSFLTFFQLFNLVILIYCLNNLALQPYNFYYTSNYYLKIKELNTIMFNKSCHLLQCILAQNVFIYISNHNGFETCLFLTKQENFHALW